ncbi:MULTISPECIES: DUF3791 domain-containing protein [unclassified Parabacteroides]|jgi:hypothetical protein|uniref:DUF3791 domain-containing protein n=2 Tax=Parabacteroides TaxID=375288 RepID=UPI000EFE96CB|nr:DUF3791 domain-containing protein [Parabacteroides sp. TM07-1AC]RHU21825.1 DUF3791 domain-containing protein [Parabacteroides sp. TM07-1AC]
MSQANEILLQMKYARIIMGFSKRLEIDSRRGLRLFYQSDLYKVLRQKIGDIHCLGDNYLIDELIIEYARKQGA